MKLNFRHLAIGIFVSVALATSFVRADNFMAVGIQGKVFDEPKSTGYVTLNSKNEEVTVIPGMAFKVLESQNGWNIIEYSPGLRGYLSDEVKASKSIMPKAGAYNVSNNKGEKVNITLEAGNWTATSGNKQFKGKAEGNIIIFLDADGKPAYSLLDIGNGGVVMTYNNAVTKFF